MMRVRFDLFATLGLLTAMSGVLPRHLVNS